MATRFPKVASETDSEPDRLAVKRYAAKAARLLKSGAAHIHQTHGAESVRTAEHDGHRITVRTRYAIEVDGQRCPGA